MFTDPKVIAAFTTAMQKVNAQLLTGLGAPCFQLRVGTPSDISECTAIHAKIRQKDRVDLGLNDVYEQRLKEENGGLMVAVSPDNKVIGAVCLNYDAVHGWHIDVISSSPDHRNAGPIGTALCCAVIASLQEMNVNRVSLQAAIAVHHPTGVTFNQKLFDWYEQKFKFEMNEPMFADHMDMTIPEIASNYGLNVIDMDNAKLKDLKVEPILQEAILKKQAAKESKKTEDIFTPILKLIEDFRASHPAPPPDKPKSGRLSLLLSRASKEHKGSNQAKAQTDAIDALEKFVISAQQSPDNIEKLKSHVELNVKNAKKVDPEVSKLCQTILDEHLPKPTITPVAIKVHK